MVSLALFELFHSTCVASRRPLLALRYPILGFQHGNGERALGRVKGDWIGAQHRFGVLVDPSPICGQLCGNWGERPSASTITKGSGGMSAQVPGVADDPSVEPLADFRLSPVPIQPTSPTTSPTEVRRRFTPTAETETDRGQVARGWTEHLDRPPC